jgi:hypothetical protein
VFLFFSCARNNRSDCGKQFIPKHDSTNTHVHFSVRCDIIAHVHIISLIQTHARLVSLQMREQPRLHITHQNQPIKSVFLLPALCFLHTPLHTDCIDACAHSGILRICMRSAHVPYSSYLDLVIMSVVRFAFYSRF